MGLVQDASVCRTEARKIGLGVFRQPESKCRSVELSNGANDKLVFTWTMNLGEDGVDDDPINPVSRSLDCLLRTGRPLHKTALCFCALPGKEKEQARLR